MQMEQTRMDPNNPYFKQVELLVQMLPEVAKYKCFALKGGTAINLFARDLPRLSVDIDLAYTPVNGRDEALAEIDTTFLALNKNIIKLIPSLQITKSKLNDTEIIYKLLTQLENTQVKIEISPVMRGVVNECVQLETSAQTQESFGFASVPVVSFNDLYAGKLCAALDRQHPRDLFDVSMLLRNEGITDELIDTFIVYLISGNRPISELLAPIKQSTDQQFFKDFEGMTIEPVTIEELRKTQIDMVEQINQKLTQSHKQFLMSFKQGNPDWALLNTPSVEQLPAIKWKLHNINKMPKQKHKKALDKLEKVLN